MVTDGALKEDRKLDGYHANETLVFNTSLLILHFHSDEINTERGFHLRYIINSLQSYGEGKSIHPLCLFSYCDV